MVAPLLIYGAVAGLGALGGFGLSGFGGGNKSSQDTQSNQTTDTTQKQASKLETKAQTTTNTTSNTTNTQNFSYNFGNSNLTNASLGFGGIDFKPQSSTSPKTDTKLTPTSGNSAGVTPQFSVTPTQTSVSTTEKSIFENPLVLGGLALGGYMFATDSGIFSKGGGKK